MVNILVLQTSFLVLSTTQLFDKARANLVLCSWKEGVIYMGHSRHRGSVIFALRDGVWPVPITAYNGSEKVDLPPGAQLRGPDGRIQSSRKLRKGTRKPKN